MWLISLYVMLISHVIYMFVSLLGCLVYLHWTYDTCICTKHCTKHCSIYSTRWKGFVLSQRIYHIIQYCSWFSLTLKYCNCQYTYTYMLNDICFLVAALPCLGNKLHPGVNKWSFDSCDNTFWKLIQLKIQVMQLKDELEKYKIKASLRENHTKCGCSKNFW